MALALQVRTPDGELVAVEVDASGAVADLLRELRLRLGNMTSCDIGLTFAGKSLEWSEAIADTGMTSESEVGMSIRTVRWARHHPDLAVSESRGYHILSNTETHGYRNSFITGVLPKGETVFAVRWMGCTNGATIGVVRSPGSKERRNTMLSTSLYNVGHVWQNHGPVGREGGALRSDTPGYDTGDTATVHVHLPADEELPGVMTIYLNFVRVGEVRIPNGDLEAICGLYSAGSSAVLVDPWHPNNLPSQ
eukprot:Sspe_Gene.1161::Locus_397_Transcript_1_1_Confidence_1.000_Length_890::g.1161::m.1161